tara:strand:- start:2204 stop:2359 length:156 start_codon:yes stop_codon:yes gene_type:complete
VAKTFQPLVFNVLAASYPIPLEQPVISIVFIVAPFFVTRPYLLGELNTRYE